MAIRKLLGTGGALLAVASLVVRTRNLQGWHQHRRAYAAVQRFRTPAAGNANPATVRQSHPAPSAAVPTVQGPITSPGKASLALSSFPLSKVGYSESEYFFSGTAHSLTSANPLTSDGMWSVQPADSAPYTSRMIVAQPSNPAKFSGTVIVEWFNVTAGFDANPDWGFGHDQMIRSGDVYVGVSAQAAGVKAMSGSDPARYGSLVHPGDAFSYDIFSQAGMAVRSGSLLPKLHPTTVIADGESQSALRMMTYVNSAAPLNNVYDGYLIHSPGSGGNTAPLSQKPNADIPIPDALRVRTDLTVPVLLFLTETDVLGVMNFYPALQPDTNLIRSWEVVGTAHADTYESFQAGKDALSPGSGAAQFASLLKPPSSISVQGFSISCPVGFNAGQQHYVFNTAISDLTAWVRTGTPPKKMPRFQIVGAASGHPKYAYDKNGNVKGGIRTPAVDAPVAVLSGLPSNGPSYCVFFGQTRPFAAKKLAKLYPKHADFLKAWKLATAKDKKAGYLLPVDAKALVAAVATSCVPKKKC